MNHQQRVTGIAAILLLVCLGAAALTVRRLDQLRAAATAEEVLYIPSPKLLQRMSLGYTGLLADIYWTRVVQYFGTKHHEHAREYKLLQPLLEITTTLDPHLVVAYEFGAVFLSQRPPEGAGEPDAAVRLVERGIRQNPTEWRLYYNLGFIHYLERRDYVAAAQAFERGSQVPGALPWMKVMAAAMAQHAGEVQTARFFWTNLYQSSEDDLIRANAIRRLRALKVDDDVLYLENLLRQYRERTGQQPANWAQLVAAGYLRGIPTDPLGKPYQLMPGGRVQVQDPDDLPFITHGLPPGREPSNLVPEESK